MLHEILLSLSGYPSPLLHAGPSPEADVLAGVTPPERQVLASAAHMSDLHTNLIAYSSEISATHTSAICRAVATAISSVHLAAFQRKILDVETSILSNDTAYVGAYNIVPLTAVMSEFQQWTRRLEWLWDVVRYMMAADHGGSPCKGAALIDRFRDELQSGYQDIAQTAESLVTVAETAWLKQVSAWVLYGRLPDFGADDFFAQKMQEASEEYICIAECLPSFVTGATAASMLFVGKSINHVRTMDSNAASNGMGHVSGKLRELSRLTFPLESLDFSRAIQAIRVSLSRNILQKILPLTKVSEMMLLLRGFLLLGRGEFAMALIQEADEKIRNRWRRAGNLVHEKDQGIRNIVVKDGEVTAVLNRTWAILLSMQGQHAEEDDQLDMARELIQLHLTKSKPPAALVTGKGLDVESANLLAASPFRNLLFSVPAMLSLQVPPPLDMVISTSDLQLYSCINAYLLAMRRAHIRLTNLWKVTSLRRHFPSPRGASDQAVNLRERWSDRSWLLRSLWTTASAAIFFLGETEAYFQTEVVEGLWENFNAWLTQPPCADHETSGNSPSSSSHDPQTLSNAHTLYLRILTHRLLLTQPTFTNPLYDLLSHIDRLVNHLHRLNSLFTSLDLEQDAGVVDASIDLEREQSQVFSSMYDAEQDVKRGIGVVVDALRALEADAKFLADCEGHALIDEDFDLVEERAYSPGRVGGVDRLLMKLDFGSWLGS